MTSEEIKVPFGAKDSELKWWEYTVSEGYEARIEGNKVIIEPKESENERTKKELISYLIDIIDNISSEEDIPHDAKILGGKIRRWITYIEKQKEQKHSLNFDAISSWLRDHASNYVNGEFNEFHHTVEYDGTFNVEKLIADLKAAVDGGAFDVDAAFNTRKPRDNWEYIKEFCDKFGRMPKDMDELDALVSYVMDKKQKEQEPLEWSENEKKVLDSIIDDYEKAAKSFCGYDGKIMLLKTIRDGEYDLSKQKWSEEDDVLLKEIVSFFKDGTVKLQHDLDLYAGFLENKFKSLQPHWKPSEKQMKALEYFIRSWGESGTMSPQNPTICAANSLLTDLQKLL